MKPPMTGVLTTTVAIAAALLTGCATHSTGERTAPSVAFPVAPDYDNGYWVFAGDSRIYTAKSIRFDGPWAVMECRVSRPGGGQHEATVWVPRESIRAVELVKQPRKVGQE